MVIALTVALVGVGFGHRMVAPDRLDLTAYAMPDGTLPQLCLDGSGHDQTAEAPCPACTIVAAFLLPTQVAPAPILLAANMADWPAPVALLRPMHQPRAPPARGPPSSFLI